jgi:hypothetical protein
MKRSIELDLTGDLSREKLAEFIDATPPEATLTTIVHVTPKDRPWESERVTAALRAEWE